VILAAARKRRRRVHFPQANEPGAAVPDAKERSAAERVEDALLRLQQAQALVDEAAQALCRVSGMVYEWRKLGRLQGETRRTYYAISARADRLSAKGRLCLDGEAQAGRGGRG
jgi:hypothetical protein